MIISDDNFDRYTLKQQANKIEEEVCYGESLDAEKEESNRYKEGTDFKVHEKALDALPHVSSWLGMLIII